jgi:uncharacterized membrane protein YgaE (UPF0421/DUF939 family)
MMAIGFGFGFLNLIMTNLTQIKKSALELAQAINQKILEQKEEIEQEQKKIIKQKLKQQRRKMEKLRKELN